MKYNINFDERVVYFGEGNQEPVVMTFEELRHLQAEIDSEEMSRDDEARYENDQHQGDAQAEYKANL